LEKNIDSLDNLTINHVGDESRDEEISHASDEMHAFGIYSRLDQVFDAPHEVKEVLIGQFKPEQSLYWLQGN